MTRGSSACDWLSLGTSSGQIDASFPVPVALPARWLPAVPVITVQPDEAHIWRGRANSAAARTFAGHLSWGEHVHASRFRSEESRDEFVASRGFVRMVLSRYLKVLPHAVELREARHGKPELADRPGRVVQFNVSHSGGVVLAAVAAVQVGVDIECTASEVDFSEIAPIVFSRAEQTWLSRVPRGQQQRHCFQCWTRKEAFVKASGEGLFDGINQLAILPSVDNLAVHVRGISVGDQWTVKDVDVGHSFAAAVAVARANCNFRFFEMAS